MSVVGDCDNRAVCLPNLLTVAIANSQLRVINAEYEGNRLPLASEPPTAEDFLPRASSDTDTYFRVMDDLLLPNDVVPRLNQWQTPKAREFTTVGSFGAAVQATYLASCVTRHILNGNKDLPTRANDAHKLDIALQSFVGSCIPPPYVSLNVQWNILTLLQGGISRQLLWCFFNTDMVGKSFLHSA
jgi:hypothetical protein